jgi:hypothetical protein
MQQAYYAWHEGRGRWDRDSIAVFMLTSVLKSRTETGIESNAKAHDQDVNVYLAGLLASPLDPEYGRRTAPLISHFDTDVAAMARGCDERERYRIYKVNADHILLMNGLFARWEEAAGRGQPGAAPPHAMRIAIGRGGTYYEIAASHGRALARRLTAPTAVLEKLSRGFAEYVTILQHLRSHYFNLIDRLGRRGMEAIQESIAAEARSADHMARVDRLLDLYSAWRQGGDPALLPAMREAVAAIRAVDPEFRFELPG